MSHVVKASSMPGAIDVEATTLDEFDAAGIARLKHWLQTTGLIRFCGLDIDEQEQLRFASQFGSFSDLDSRFHGRDMKTMNDQAATYFSTNEVGNGTVEIDFHQEYAYAIDRPRYVMLFGIDVPTNGGETLFANAADVLERLPTGVVDELASCQVRNTSPANGTSVVFPAIERHPLSGREYVTVNRLLTTELVGVPAARGQELMSIVFEHLYDEDHVFVHRWRKGDLIMWDNHVLQHARAPVDTAQPRELRRCMLADDTPTPIG